MRAEHVPAGPGKLTQTVGRVGVNWLRGAAPG